MLRPTSAAVCVVSDGYEDIFDLAVWVRFSLHFHWLAVCTISFYANVRLRLARHAYRGFPDDWVRWRFKRFQRRSDPEDFFGFLNREISASTGGGRPIQPQLDARCARLRTSTSREVPERHTKKRSAPSGPTRVYDRGRSRERRGDTSRLFERVFYAPFLCRGGVLHFLVAELHVA